MSTLLFGAYRNFDPLQYFGVGEDAPAFFSRSEAFILDRQFRNRIRFRFAPRKLLKRQLPIRAEIEVATIEKMWRKLRRRGSVEGVETNRILVGWRADIPRNASRRVPTGFSFLIPRGSRLDPSQVCSCYRTIAHRRLFAQFQVSDRVTQRDF